MSFPWWRCSWTTRHQVRRPLSKTARCAVPFPSSGMRPKPRDSEVRRPLSLQWKGPKTQGYPTFPTPFPPVDCAQNPNNSEVRRPVECTQIPRDSEVRRPFPSSGKPPKPRDSEVSKPPPFSPVESPQNPRTARCADPFPSTGMRPRPKDRDSRAHPLRGSGAGESC